MGSTFKVLDRKVFVWDHPHIHGEHPGHPAIILLSPRDHPHIHGEHLTLPNQFCLCTGSPPYTWGARLVSPVIMAGFRITPIYMGSTTFVFLLLVASRDHPHIHGEHAETVCVGLVMLGSPPYTWGAPGCRMPNVFYLGITPIYMGSTQSMDGTNWNLQDHPHIHGEHHLGPGPRRPLQDHPHIHGEH